MTDLIPVRILAGSGSRQVVPLLDYQQLSAMIDSVIWGSISNSLWATKRAKNSVMLG